MGANPQSTRALSFSIVWLFCDPMDGNPPCSSIHGILQARMQGWVAISSSRGSSQGWNPRLLCLLHWPVGSLPLMPPEKPKSMKRCGQNRFQHIKMGMECLHWTLTEPRGHVGPSQVHRPRKFYSVLLWSLFLYKQLDAPQISTLPIFHLPHLMSCWDKIPHHRRALLARSSSLNQGLAMASLDNPICMYFRAPPPQGIQFTSFKYQGV